MRTQLIIWFILIPTLTITAHTAYCQSPSKQKKIKLYKAKISVSTREPKVVGILQKVSDSAVYVLDGSASVKVPANEINDIIIRRKGIVGRRVLTGTLAGAGAGGLVGLVLGVIDCNSGGGFCVVGEATLAVAVLGAGVGAVTGLFLSGKAEEKIIVGQNLVEFERNAALLRRYEMPAVDVPTH